jgi:hypothetical protein
MRKYNPNPKHEMPWTPGCKGSKLDLSVAEATLLLNDPLHCVEVPGKRQLVAVKGNSIYVFQDDGTGGYHAYPITGQEVCANYPSIARQMAGMLRIGFKQLSRRDE